MIRIERFWERVDRRGPDECWPWTGGVTDKGYGLLRGSDGKGYRAHRLSWTIAGNSLSKDEHVHHLCHNKLCVNPAHLEVIDPSTHGVIHHPLKEHCPYGHLKTIPRRGRGGTRCKECPTIKCRERRARLRAEREKAA